MKKVLVAIATIIIIALLVTFTACNNNNKAETTTTTTTTTTATTTTIETPTETPTETPVTGVKFEDLPEATTTTTAVDYSEQLKEIYKNLGIEYVTGMATYEIEDNQLIIQSLPNYGDVGAICPTKKFLESHDFEFFGTNIEKYQPDVLPDGKHVEGSVVALFESDPEHIGIRWDGELKIIVDGKYVVIIDPA